MTGVESCDRTVSLVRRSSFNPVTKKLPLVVFTAPARVHALHERPRLRTRDTYSHSSVRVCQRPPQYPPAAIVWQCSGFLRTSKLHAVQQRLRARTPERAPRHAPHPGGNPEANLESISHRCHPLLVVFVWELTKETINLPLGCLQGGRAPASSLPLRLVR